MSHYANNMPPSATAGAYSGMGMPSYGMQPNAEAATSAWANNPPAYTSPAAYPQTMGYSPMHCGPMKPAPIYGAVAGYGAAYSTGSILVLFILLVIISRAFL